jgi:translation elongation factor EF-4
MQLTGTIHTKSSGGKNEQVLDKLKVERERGITGQTLYSPTMKKKPTDHSVVKAQTARYEALFPLFSRRLESDVI